MQTVIKLILLFSVGCQGLFEENFKEIVGGENARFPEIPWIGSLRQRGIHFCGAVIIKKKWVITAAHCTAEASSKNGAITVVAGRVRQNGFELSEQTIRVEKYFQHLKYNNETLENDISLLKMSRPFRFDPFVKAIKLPKEKQQPFSGTCIVTGWGRLKSGGYLASTLQKVLIPVISDEECKKRFKDYKKVKVEDSMICAWAKGKDSCQGDSGGPFVCYDGGISYLAGITSWGIGCAHDHLPGVYTEVSYFLGWINDIIENNS